MIGKIFNLHNGVKFKILLLMIFINLILSACALMHSTSTAPVKPAKIAVVLGGGGSKGFAHIGVLKVLEAQNIPIHMIVGTSAGSLGRQFIRVGQDLPLNCRTSP